ncbi:YaaC family protein [Alkalihalobacillus sp. AL-G]|uniref:YaaC family protein n=1 Tax=Alkalihalobacillus sp. AL-G TaxID=2926399 RepID=UPI00272B3A77|nr:YaaC family protein [Alkalihalobacillus sp. AL-G]WLD93403.1 YaaC family protein [Alkalihalobacillus sp. AL-G]
MKPLNQWKNYEQFLSAPRSQRYLKRCYEQLGQNQNIDELSYRNCYSFIYYLTHGRRHYELAEKAPLELQPVLQYYGMVQLIKCCLLTVDPLYPESTILLAHGVTTRKRKKQNYLFLDDEIKIQRNGLFPYFSEQMFHMKHLEGDKIQMNKLFGQIPEINELFSQLNRRPYLIEVDCSKDGRIFSIPNEILDHLHMTANRFTTFLTEQINPAEISTTVQPSTINITVKDQNAFKRHNTLFKKSLDGKWFIPITRDGFQNLHEVMVHYLLLYNLSMICRYETEWWSELFHTYSSDDYPFISQFLAFSKRKVPYLLLNYLDEKRVPNL